MGSSNVCWGIEIGSGGISAIKLETSGSGFNVLDFAVLPHKRVMSTPDLDQAEAMRLALGAFAGQYDLTGAQVAVSVPGHAAFARFAKLPPVEPKKVPDIVKFEAVQQIPFPIDDVEWDYQTFVSPDSPEVEVGIFAITRDRIMERLRLYEEVGLTPDFVTLSPVAAYNAVAYDLEFGEKTPGTIILDIGTTSTDLVISEPGRVWVRTFPIGGHHFTEAVVSAFQLSYPKAEKLKREAESTKHARHVFQAMRPVFADLAQDVQRSIGYYQSLHKDAKLTRLIGLGSTFRLPGIRKFLRQQLQLDVYRLEQFKRLNVEGTRAGEFQASAINLATAYGLALQGLGEAALNVNLMPAAVIKAAMWKRKIPWFGVAAAVALAASGAMFTRWFMDRTNIADNPRPQVVDEVLRQVALLKGEAADVIAGDPNLLASDLMGLLANRGVYAQIVGDVKSILATAQERAGAWPPEGVAGSTSKAWGPALVVTRMSAVYEPEVTAADLESSFQGGVAHPARIKVDVEFETTQPEPMRFALRTIDEWLRANTERPGVPYTIQAGTPASRIVGTPRTIAAAEEPGKPAGGAAPAGRGARMSEAELIKESQRLMEEQGRRKDVINTGDTRAPAVSAAEREGSQNWARDLDEVKKEAPLAEPPGPPPGTVITTISASWYAVIAGPKAPAEGGT
ncbi:MAG: type IV pilus assembly protein PilM [Phycisphaerales bacterium]|nr:type IV pilus assembly protein PilM [Phycisphaerales bacterium]